MPFNKNYEESITYTSNPFTQELYTLDGKNRYEAKFCQDQTFMPLMQNNSGKNVYLRMAYLSKLGKYINKH